MKTTAKPWPTWARWTFGLAGAATSAVVAYLAMLTVLLVAVAMGAAPLGLVGGTTPTQPWVNPTAFVIAAATFLLLCLLIIRFLARRH